MSFHAIQKDVQALPHEACKTNARPYSWDPVYGAPLTGRNIRLLQLASGCADARLECRLIEVSIDDPGPYEALSYVWGDASITEPIECNGEIVHVTTNLVKALKKVRSGISKPRSMEDTRDSDTAVRYSSYINISRPTEMSPSSILLWADAICINQTNVIERNLQVALMGAIYSKAQRVIVWLGDAAIEADQAAAVLVAVEVFELVLFLQACYERPNASQLNFTHKDLMELMFDRGYNVKEEVWATVSALFASAWFTRIWCVQEIVLARDATVLFSFGEFKLHVIQALAQWLVDLCLAHQISPPHVKDALVNITEARNRLARDNHNVADILTFINVYSRLSATDPRDKIYGLLGLVGPDIIKIDYAKSTLEVYSSLVLNMLDRGLQILSHVYHPVEIERSDGFPSWVPRFDKGRSKVRFYDFPRDNELSGQTPKSAVCPILAATGILRMSGLQCDTVSSIDYIRFDPENLIYGSIVNTGQEFLHYVVDLWCETQPLDSAGNFSDVVLAYSLGLNLTGGHMDFYTMVDDLEKAEQFKFLRCFLAFMKQLIPSGLDWIDLEGADSGVFIRMMTLYCNDRKLFRTSKGWLGLGPRCMRPDDSLVVLDGGPMPYILRPTEGTNQFLFMGDCYVSAIRRGEVYDLVGTDGIEKRVFDLV